MTNHEKIVILTGAGLSAESGISTFRDKDGIWSKYNIEDVATPEAFHKNPELVNDFYNQRRQGHAGLKPNKAHEALAELEHMHNGDVLLVTQNIDSLHEQAGSTKLIHMHGEIYKAFCSFCKYKIECTENLSQESVCPNCNKARGMRPDVVWFGEMPYQMDRIYNALAECDLFISIGTSGNVYPASGFVAEARQNGAYTVELNLEPSQGINMFHEAIHGKATEVVPAYVHKLLHSDK